MKWSTADIEARSVAVIGMACRFPGASGTDELWELLRHGVDATSETPPDRYDVNALHSASPHPEPGTVGTRRAGYVGRVADFDAEFFGISPAEAAELDPQQRLLLMVAWEALEDAGVPAGDLAGSRTGVFVGNARGDFLERQFRQGLDAVTPNQYLNFRSLLPARLSYAFDLRGPSTLVDTACSSSLVAVHSALQSLRAGETPLAIVAGVSLVFRPDEAVMMTQTGTLARDGRSKFGDAAADGYAPSDGVGVVVLKPLAAARADGDRIRAVIQGSAVGNDGRGSGSLMAPSLDGQTDILRWAYEDAGVSPADVDFVEAHGMGSPALDPLEFRALGEILGAGRDAERPLLVGSVKTNIGHAEAAGGMAGLIKTVLSLEHGQLPGSIHLSSPNPDIPWDELPLMVPTRLQPLPDRGRPLIAGVTGQGVSSLNAHLVLRQADAVPEPAPQPGDDLEPHVLALSAHSPKAMIAMVRTYAGYLGDHGHGRAYTLRDICFSAATRRQHHDCRLAVVASSHAEMAAVLERYANGGGGPVPVSDDPPSRYLGLLTAIAERYTQGNAVNWASVFGPGCRYVPLPTYPWQTTRYWPGEQPRSGENGDLATAVLREHSRSAEKQYTDNSLLSEMGIDSLARIQIIVKLASDHGYQVEAEELAELRTVGDFRAWFHVMQEAQAV